MPGQSRSLSTVRVALPAVVALLFTVGHAEAHRLIVNCQVLPGRKVQVLSLYSDPFRSFPAAHADVRVFLQDDRLLAQGKTDVHGEFVFTYDTAQRLRVKVSQVDHEAEVSISPQELAIERRAPIELTESDGSKSPPGRPSQSKPGSAVISSAESPLREGLKDILVGVTFLLAAAAFILSLRNARRLRDLKPAPLRGAAPDER